MLKLKHFGMAVVIVLCAFSAMASNFRAADQVYVPAAGHVAGGSGTFISDLFISNLSSDSVTVSVIYASTPSGTVQNFTNLFTLAPNERREFIDFFVLPQSQGGLGLASGFGQLIFNGCKASSDCTPDPTTGLNANFRNISVESRIYVIPPNTTLAQNPPTSGQAFAGIPWYNFVSSDTASVGLDKVFITGLRNTGGAGTAGTYRGNIGLVNASQFSTTTLVVKLLDGKTGSQIGSSFNQTLGPLGHTQLNLGAMFSTFTGSTATNAFVTIEQTGTTPTGDAAANGCPTGCPAFFAYGSVLDNASSDATTLEPQYLKPLSDAAIACIYNPTGATCKTAPSIRRAVKH